VEERTIPELLVAAVERDADHEWIRADDGTMTFGTAAAVVADAAERLRASGIGLADRVVITARTTPTYLLAWLATSSLGAVSVLTNPASTTSELAGILAQTAPTALVTDAALRDRVDEAVAVSGGKPTGLDVDDVVGDWANAKPSEDLPRTIVRPDDVAVFIPTSGTTGRSKLVMQTHRAYAMAGEGFPYWLELTADDRLMTSLPLFHVNAQAYSVMGSLAAGAGLVLLPRFSASGFLDGARRHGATEFNAIGAMLEILMRQPERPDDVDTPLRLCYLGPTPARERQEEMERRFGLRIVCGYGMSETTYGTVWAHGTRPYGTIGSLRQHPDGTVNEGRVVDGELQLRNPAVMTGYWQLPEETAAVLVDDGWLRTGDLVTENADGTYTYVARAKEVVRRRGENLSPAEVEDAIDSHPGVAECAVVGVPSELTEDDVKAFVVPVAGADLDFVELRAFTAERLAAYKVPRYWQRLEALPRTPTERVAKHELPTGHPESEYDAEAQR
jgi:crotonobetaine/carnitine-CoA ligase